MATIDVTGMIDKANKHFNAGRFAKALAGYDIGNYRVLCQLVHLPTLTRITHFIGSARVPRGHGPRAADEPRRGVA